MAEIARPLTGLCAADIMSQSVVMIPREMSLQGAARMLALAGVTGAPVVDAAGRCIGVLSATDFMNWVKEDHKNDPTNHCGGPLCTSWQIPEDADDANGCVESYMTKDPVLVTANVKIGELARMMMDAHIHRLIVVDRITGRPIGVVSSMDILAAVARADRGTPDECDSEDTLHDL
jgi:CBS domain-containing protein